jgi:chromosome segregation ATPase
MLRREPEFKRMDSMDKTVKLHAYSEPAKSEVARPAAAEKNVDSELAKVNSLLEEEKSKSLELLKTIVQLRESLKQEQARAAEMEAKLNKLVAVEENQLARKNAQLEEEKARALELTRTIEQLRDMIRQDQTRHAGLEKQVAELQAKGGEWAALEARVKDMSAALSKISSVVAAVKLDDGA